MRFHTEALFAWAASRAVRLMTILSREPAVHSDACFPAAVSSATEQRTSRNLVLHVNDQVAKMIRLAGRLLLGFLRLVSATATSHEVKRLLISSQAPFAV